MLAWHVCDRLGMPHPDYVLQCLTPAQWCDWRARWEVDPWGEQRADLRAAASAAIALAPYASDQQSMPSPVYPYFGDDNDNSPEELDRLWQQAVELDKHLQERWRLAREAEHGGNDLHNGDQAEGSERQAQG